MFDMFANICSNRFWIYKHYKTFKECIITHKHSVINVQYLLKTANFYYEAIFYINCVLLYYQ